MSSGHDGRFAPSPTGPLHVGNLRTALAAWLVARSHGARFALRIDDLDPERSRPEHERCQLEDLQLLGLDWDGEPVRQSDRLHRYDEILDLLARAQLTYPCFCTRAEVLAAATAPHGPGVEAPYPGTCSHLSTTAAAARIAAGDPHCTRVRAEGCVVGFDDGMLGRVEAVVDDFIVRRRDAVAAYNLASPVDESDLAVEEVVRGADLAPTTPRQLWLATRAGLTVPRFVHLPLVLGPDGARLAKRHGATSLAQLREIGVDAPAVLAHLGAMLGIEVASAAPHTASDLLAGFDLARVPRSDVHFDPLDTSES